MTGSPPLDPVRWDDAARAVRLIDQRKLPGDLVYWSCVTVEEVAEAIETLAVRGAPAIGIAAAFGVLLGAVTAKDPASGARGAIERLGRTRPTAVNLFHDLDRMGRILEADATGDLIGRLRAEAERILAEDLLTGLRIAEAGITLFPETGSIRVLTHCNAGALATGGWGTALAPIYAGQARGRQLQVLADETRPLFQGSRLTAWEMARAGIPVEVVVDGAAASHLARGEVDLVIVGADRIAANGDTANKIGTYPLALAAREAGVPFYVAAPIGTFDPETPTGAGIPVEERGTAEILGTAIPGVSARNLAFDVTPARLITAWITDRGVLKPPFTRDILETGRKPD